MHRNILKEPMSDDETTYKTRGYDVHSQPNMMLKNSQNILIPEEKSLDVPHYYKISHNYDHKKECKEDRDVRSSHENIHPKQLGYEQLYKQMPFEENYKSALERTWDDGNSTIETDCYEEALDLSLTNPDSRLFTRRQTYENEEANIQSAQIIPSSLNHKISPSLAMNFQKVQQIRKRFLPNPSSALCHFSSASNQSHSKKAKFSKNCKTDLPHSTLYESQFSLTKKNAQQTTSGSVELEESVNHPLQGTMQRNLHCLQPPQRESDLCKRAVQRVVPELISLVRRDVSDARHEPPCEKSEIVRRGQFNMENDETMSILGLILGYDFTAAQQERITQQKLQTRTTKNETNRTS